MYNTHHCYAVFCLLKRKLYSEFGNSTLIISSLSTKLDIHFKFRCIGVIYIFYIYVKPFPLHLLHVVLIQLHHL